MGHGPRGIRSRGARTAAAIVALALGLTGLTACRTNVGSAATVAGHRISESDVQGYLTDSAKPVTTSDSQSIAPRSFVLLFLLDERLITKLLSTPPATMPSKGKLATAIDSAVKASGGRAAVIKNVGLEGYTKAFQTVFIRTSVLQILLHQEAGDAQGQLSVAQLAKELKFDAKRSFRVRVNPRYGTWDADRLTLDFSGSVPSYLKLQSTPAT